MNAGHHSPEDAPGPGGRARTIRFPPFWQAYVARQMPREAAIVLRKLAARPGVDPALVQWARDSLGRLGPAANPSPAVPGGGATPAPKP